MDEAKVQEIVREAYGRIAQGQQGCGCAPTCCGPDPTELAKSIGYSLQELAEIPDEANLALGCGNPTALAGLKEGEVVLDLGSGAGIDCFLAATKVGPSGRVIGVDMTPEMVQRARSIAARNGFENVEFRLGEIENLPVADNSVDVVISNCVINLSADKERVFRQIYRVLKPGGRVAIADVALLKELPQQVRESVEAYVGCVAGALRVDAYRAIVERAGLQDVEVEVKGTPAWGDPYAEYVVSVDVRGRKPDLRLG